MDTITYSFGRRLNEIHALQVVADFALFDVGKSVRLNFSQTRHFEPFGMLLVGSAIRRLQAVASKVGTNVTVETTGIEDDGIAAHLGFWRSIDVKIGREVNADAGKESYLPIRRIEVAELYKSSAGRDPLASGVIEECASGLAKILCRPRSKPLQEALTYSFRELIRNVVEHAMSPTIWVCGMSWPKRDFVQVAILDEGRGIRRSLADNEAFAFETDLKALEEAIRPDVSRNLGRQRSDEYLANWEEQRHDRPHSYFENSGYGLFLVSSLCREAGQFHVASGSAYLGFLGSAQLPGTTFHHGTAIRLVLEPTKVEGALDRLFEGVAVKSPAAHRPLLTASKLRSLGLDTLFPGSGGE